MTRKIKLYHYKPLSTLENFSHLMNYMNQKIWLTRLAEFNDPFEAQFDFKYATAQEILASPSRFHKYYDIIKKANPAMTKEELENELKKPEADNKLGVTRRERNFFNSFGAICLTSSCSNIPMWAHYTNYHQGYCVIFEIDLDYLSEKCLGFNLDKVFNPKQDGSDQEILSFKNPLDDINIRFVLTKVIYKEDRPIMEEIKEDELHNKSEYEKIKYFVTNSFGVKYKQWAYEEEYRLVVTSNSKGSGLMDINGYSFIKITGIIMGRNIGKNMSKDASDFMHSHELSICRFNGSSIDEKVKEFIAQLAKKHGIKIYLAKCSDEKYEIIYDEYIPS